MMEDPRVQFGAMLLNWRRQNSWTQYTACKWAKEAGFEAISYGNLSVIEQGKAGELRQKAFLQLEELNRRIAEKDWGPLRDQEIKEKVTAAQPLGDDECPSWGAVEFWSCYIGRRAVPAKLQSDVPPLLSSKKTREINNRWRSGTKRLIAEDVVSMDAALIGPPIPWDMVKDWRRMMLEIRDFNSSEIEKMWVSDSLYIPDVWLAGLRGANNA